MMPTVYSIAQRAITISEFVSKKSLKMWYLLFLFLKNILLIKSKVFGSFISIRTNQICIDESESVLVLGISWLSL